MDCLDVTILENTVKDVKSSAIFNEIEELINEMTETIGKIRQSLDFDPLKKVFTERWLCALNLNPCLDNNYII